MTVIYAVFLLRLDNTKELNNTHIYTIFFTFSNFELKGLLLLFVFFTIFDVCILMKLMFYFLAINLH